MGVYYDAFKSIAKTKQLLPNDAQLGVAKLLDTFLTTRVINYKPRFFTRRPWFGAYIHGPVGTGKTMLMDVIPTALPPQFTTKRYHFLEFIQHARTNHIDATSRDVLLLDELQVVDIADAMTLRSVVERVDRGGGWMVLTGNRHPDDLYLDGPQRATFLPTIALMKERMLVWPLVTEDYRKSGNSYYHPISKETYDLALLEYHQIPIEDQSMTIPIANTNRTIHLQHCKPNHAVLLPYHTWFPQARGPTDHLALCLHFPSLIVITGCPRMTGREEARRFVDFVDVAWGRGVRLVVQGGVPVERLFGVGGEEGFAACRTISRLR